MNCFNTDTALTTRLRESQYKSSFIVCSSNQHGPLYISVEACSSGGGCAEGQDRRVVFKRAAAVL